MSLDLDRLEALAKAATEPAEGDFGVWEVETRRTLFGILRNFGLDRFGQMWQSYVVRDVIQPADAEFIAAADPATVRELVAEVRRLERWKAEALPVMDGLQELGAELGLPLGARITGPEALAAVRQLRAGMDELERQLDAEAKHAALGPNETCDVCTHRQAEDLIAECEKAEAERDALAESARALSEALGFGDGETEPAATLAQLVDPLTEALSAASDHDECPVRCDRCGETLAATRCAKCHGSGCLPNAELAYLECDECAGVGRVHEGCVEQTYAALAARVERAEAVLRDFAEHGTRHDLTPTMRGGDHGVTDLLRYIGRMDEAVRDRARRALEVEP